MMLMRLRMVLLAVSITVLATPCFAKQHSTSVETPSLHVTDVSYTSVSQKDLVRILHNEGYGSVTTKDENAVSYKDSGLWCNLLISGDAITFIVTMADAVSYEQLQRLNGHLLGASVYPNKKRHLVIQSYLLNVRGYTDEAIVKFLHRSTNVVRLVVLQLLTSGI